MIATMPVENVRTTYAHFSHSGGWLCPFCLVIGEHLIIAVIGSEQFF